MTCATATNIRLAAPFNRVLAALKAHCKQAANVKTATYEGEHPSGVQPSFHYTITGIGEFTDEGVRISRACYSGVGDPAEYDEVTVPADFIAAHAANA